MPEKSTLQRSRRDAAQGKSASTQAGEFVSEEMDHIRAGKHGARSAKQAIAIGLSKARRAGVKLKAPAKGTTSAATRRKAKQDLAKAASGRKRAPSRRRATRLNMPWSVSHAARLRIARFHVRRTKRRAVAAPRRARAPPKKQPAPAGPTET